MASIKRARLKLTGKVQGVFFRDFAKQNANKLGIVGYVKNLKSGALEILVQGDELKLETFIRLCRTGPMMAKVDDLAITWEDIDPEDELEYFDIRP